MFLHKLGIFFYQKVDSRVQSGHLIIKTQPKISSYLGHISVSQKFKRGSWFLLKIDLVNAAFLRQHINFRDFALNFRMVESFKSRQNIKFSNGVVHECETAEGMRPNRHLRQLISNTGPINISIDFFIFEHLHNLIPGRMVVPQRLNIIYIISEYNVSFFLIKFFEWFYTRNLFFIFRWYISSFKFEIFWPDNVAPNDINKYTYGVNGNPSSSVLAKNIYVYLATDNCCITAPSMDSSGP